MAMDVKEYLVCEECLLAAAGISSDEAGVDLSRALQKIEVPIGGSIFPGENDARYSFAAFPCEGCGSFLAGSRELVVVLTPTR